MNGDSVALRNPFVEGAFSTHQQAMESRAMRKAITAGSAALLIGLAGAAYAQTTPKSDSNAMKMTQAECQSLWNRLDTAKSGSVSEAAAKQYVTDFKSVDANGDGKLTQAEFQSGCDKGQVQSMATTGPGSGTGTGTGTGGATGGGTSGSKN